MEMEEGENQEAGSIIRSIMVEQEEKNRELLDPLIVVMSAINDLKDREREVLSGRFGLEDGKKITLEAVGDKFKITRERVRQIESTAIKALAKEPTKDLVRLMRIIHSFLVEAGGLISIEELAEYFKVEKDQRYDMELNALRLVMNLDPSVLPLPKSDLMKAGWMKKEFSIKLLTESLSSIEKILAGLGKPVTEDEVWEDFVKTTVYTGHKGELTPAIIFGILNVSAKIAKTSDGKWGLASWPSVIPKRIRDKVMIIMDATMKPMHFRDIADSINRKFAGKPVLSRTVHNELIGDTRFVLVGRGIYALKSWGYKAGVVSDVIKRIIEATGRPMSTEEIVEAVMKDRYVKKNTVVANLQNREWFVRAGKGLYDIRK